MTNWNLCAIMYLWNRNNEISYIHSFHKKDAPEGLARGTFLVVFTNHFFLPLSHLQIRSTMNPASMEIINEISISIAFTSPPPERRVWLGITIILQIAVYVNNCRLYKQNSIKYWQNDIPGGSDRGIFLRFFRILHKKIQKKWKILKKC